MRHIPSLAAVAAAALFFISSQANAVLVSTTGTGTLTNVDDTISGVMTFDGGVMVDYDLKLTAVSSLVDTIEWNGQGRAQPNALSWRDASGSWALELSLSQTVNLVFEQSGRSNLANEPFSLWNIFWDTPGATSIVDPDNQLIKSTGPGTTTHSHPGRLFNNVASWNIFGPDAMTYRILWENTTGGSVGTDAIGLSSDLSSISAIPVPGALLLFSSGLGVLLLGRMRRAQTARGDV